MLKGLKIASLINLNFFLYNIYPWYIFKIILNKDIHCAWLYINVVIWLSRPHQWPGGRTKQSKKGEKLEKKERVRSAHVRSNIGVLIWVKHLIRTRLFYLKRPISLHVCALCSELPSDLRTMVCGYIYDWKYESLKEGEREKVTWDSNAGGQELRRIPPPLLAFTLKNLQTFPNFWKFVVMFWYLFNFN